MALAALLGFSTACSTVRQAPREAEPGQRSESDTTQVRVEREVPPRIVLMYGVRPPLSDSARMKRLERQHPDSLSPESGEPAGEKTSGDR